MCRALSDGGQRCASYARAAVLKAQEALTASQMNGFQHRIDAAEEAADLAYAQYASTDEGRLLYTEQLREAEEAFDFDLAAQLTVTLRKGADMRAASTEVRLYHGSPVLLTPGTPLRAGSVETSPYARDETHVYVTDSVASAAQWAADANEMQGSDEPGYVYEVEVPESEYLPHDDDQGQHVTATATVLRRVR